MMTLVVEPYLDQVQRWPLSGRHILAQFDEHSIVVYQAYRPTTARFAATHGYFGGEFSFNRMSWIKPNFLWMMYRSGWGTKANQEITLAIRLKRAGFDRMLAEAVHSSFVPSVYASEAAWAEAVAHSAVRLQWDPDHDPAGAKQERRALQLGLRGAVLAAYACEWIIAIEDISPLVAQQRLHASVQATFKHLSIPREAVYPVPDLRVATRLGLDQG